MFAFRVSVARWRALLFVKLYRAYLLRSTEIGEAQKVLHDVTVHAQSSYMRATCFRRMHDRFCCVVVDQSRKNCQHQNVDILKHFGENG